MADQTGPAGPAFYARRGGHAADWWTLLHPPYTLWHLSYVGIGAALAPTLDWLVLVATLLAFFLAIGLAAHALDELQGRPLGTAISDQTLWVVAAASMAVASAVGVLIAVYAAPWLLVAIPIGVVLVLAYNLELFGGRLHTDAGFAVSWGGFPVVVGVLAQSPSLTVRTVTSTAVATAAAVLLSLAQRRLSTPARRLRRRTDAVSGVVTLRTGETEPLDRAALLTPLEGALRALCWAMPALAVALLLTHVPV